jgi:chain length determinant protein EpsF
MTISQIVSVLRARWKLVALIVVLTVCSTLGVSLLLPKQYTAKASVVIDARPDPVAGYRMDISPAYMATQVDIILSNRVSTQVVSDLRLSEHPLMRSLWETGGKDEGPLDGWLNGYVKKALTAKPSLQSNVIELIVSMPDANLSASVANGYVKAYLDVGLALRVDPAKQHSEFFGTRVREAREALERAQARLSAYQREKGVIVSEQSIDIEQARLNELSSQLVVMQSLAAESGSRQNQALSGSGDRLPEALSNPVIGGLKSDLSRSEARLQELTSRLGDNHPQVIEAKANIAVLRGRLDAETRRVSGSVGVTATINRQREAELRASLESQRARVQRLRMLREEGAVYLTDAANAQRAYEQVTTRLSESSLQSKATQSNAFMLAEAYVPSQPSSPKVALNSAMALVLGSLLAVGAALGLESIDRRVRGRDDITVALNLPVLGVLPHPDRAGPFGKSPRQPAIAASVLHQLPLSRS